ncbi:hypothetical protein Tco_1354072 [Tanacetum coccineum]
MKVLRSKRLMKLQDQFKNNQKKRKKKHFFFIFTRGYTTNDDGRFSGEKFMVEALNKSILPSMIGEFTLNNLEILEDHQVGNHTEAYQFFEDMLKIFDRDDLVMLCNFTKERFSSTEPTDDKERALWVELNRLFEPNTGDTLWKLQRYMHDPFKWILYDTCGVHHVSTKREIFHVGRERISIVKRSSDFDVG